MGTSPTPPEVCPHCDPHHGSPNRCAWGVRLGPALAANAGGAFVEPLTLERDSDGQPVYLYVAPTDGAHVAQEDADWLFALLLHRGQVDAVVEAARAYLAWHRSRWLSPADAAFMPDQLIRLAAAVDRFDEGTEP